MTETEESSHAFGWRRDQPDSRDLRLALPEAPALLPRYVNLTTTKFLPPIWHQGNLGACTAFMGAAAWCFDRAKQNLKFENPSQLFLYYNNRLLEGTTIFDAGATIRDCLKSMVKYGICDDYLWPYDISKFRNKPSDAAYNDAIKSHGVEYLRLEQNLTQLKQCLANGFPICFGCTLYESFESAQTVRTGFVTLPGMWERPIGGHAMLIVGYNSRNYFMVRNSWGNRWGDPDFKGYCWMPPQYILDTNLAADFWVMKTVSG